MFIDTHTHYIDLRPYRDFYRNLLFNRQYAKKHLNINYDDAQDKWFEEQIKGIDKSIDEEGCIKALLSDMEKAEVDASLFLSTELEMNDIILKAGEQYPKKLYAILYADPFKIVKSIDLVEEALYQKKKVHGMKALFQYFRISPIDKKLFILYEYCSDKNLPVQFHCGAFDNYALPKEYEQLSNKFPKLKIVCLHGGGARWQEFGELAKKKDNIFLELEGLQLHEAEGNKVPFILNSLIKICGSSKLMFGSDWIWGDPKYFDRVKSIKALAEPDKSNIEEKTVKSVYNLEL